MGSSLNSNTLPPSNSLDLALVHPTHEEKIATWKLNGASWGGRLSSEAYLRREEHLANQPLTRSGGITFWILVDKNDTAAPRNILASCESLRKRAFVRRLDGRVEETTAHGIASVFCNPALRGKGYAGRLMEELGKALDGGQQQAQRIAEFTVLYSDIGKQFYSRLGWKPSPSSHVSLPIYTHHEDQSISRKLPQTRPLHDSDLIDLCLVDEAALRLRIAKPTKEPSLVRVALIPDIETMQWHHAREDFLGKELLGRTPEIRGALASSEKGSRVWCVWARTFGPTESDNTFCILRMINEGESELDVEESIANRPSLGQDILDQDEVLATAAVMRAAQLEAAEWTMNDVQIWNPSPTCLAAAKYLEPLAQLIHRESESIASLRWHGPRPGDGELSWIHNEKFGWC